MRLARYAADVIGAVICLFFAFLLVSDGFSWSVLALCGGLIAAALLVISYFPIRDQMRIRSEIRERRSQSEAPITLGLDLNFQKLGNETDTIASEKYE